MKEVSASRNTNYLTKKMHTKPLFLKDINVYQKKVRGLEQDLQQQNQQGNEGGIMDILKGFMLQHHTPAD